jgi:hypothetical protein
MMLHAVGKWEHKGTATGGTVGDGPITVGEDGTSIP